VPATAATPSHRHAGPPVDPALPADPALPQDPWPTEDPLAADDLWLAENQAPPDRPPGVPEIFKAGRWDRASGRGGGFAAGGLADHLPPGAVLAGLAGDRWADGLGRLADDELIGVLRAARRLASWATAMELAALGDLWRRRTTDEDNGDTGAAEHAGDEVAAALTLTPHAAGTQLDLAIRLARLPLTSAALASGAIDAPRAKVIADEVTGLTAEHADAVEQAIIAAAPAQTTGQLRAATHRAALTADPAAAQRRKEEAQREARVERWAEPAGTAALAGRDLPPTGVLAADANLTTLAKELKAAGVPGSLDTLRAQVYLALLTGASAASLLPTTPDITTPGTITPGTTTPGTTTPGNNRPGDGQPDSGHPSHDGRPGGDWPGSHAFDRSRSGSGQPGHGDRLGSATWPSDSPGAEPGGDGYPDHDGWPRAFPASATPTRGSVNLTLPLATWLGHSSEPGHAAGYGPLDATDARHLATALADRPGNRWCLTLTAPDGHPLAHGCAHTDPPPGRWRARAGPTARDRSSAKVRDGDARSRDGTWTFTLSLLDSSGCDHAWQTPAYTPTPRLRHLVQIRHASCVFPGCRRPATQCDADHTIAYDNGGPTCLCNLAPLCRRHHQAKQTPGWALTQTTPGTMTWTTPSGRRYTVRP
jgi:hypothetical protein